MADNIKLLAAVGSLNLITFSAGNSYAWSSPMSEVLKSNDSNINPLGRAVSPMEGSWIASMISLSAVLFSLFTPYMQSQIGRKNTLIISAIPMILSHIICVFASNTIHFYIARFLLGLGVGGVFSVVPIYTGEIAENHNRGFMGSLMEVILGLGHLFVYIIGPYVHLKTLSWILMSPPILFLIFFIIFAPESPYHYVSNGDEDKAKNALFKIRSYEKDSVFMLKELESIKETINASKLNQISLVNAFKTRPFKRAITITVVLMYFQQFVGITALSSYMQSVFVAADVNFSPEISVIVVSMIQNSSVMFSSFLTDKLGRKLLLIISSSGMGVALSLMGTFFYIKHLGYNVESFFWAPLAAQAGYVFAYNFGQGPVPFVLIGELFSSQTKSYGSSLSAINNLLLAFLTALLYPGLVELVGMHGSFWFFAFNGFLCLFFVLWKIPETKGRSLQEILVILDR